MHRRLIVLDPVGRGFYDMPDLMDNQYQRTNAGRLFLLGKH